MHNLMLCRNKHTVISVIWIKLSVQFVCYEAVKLAFVMEQSYFWYACACVICYVLCVHFEPCVQLTMNTHILGYLQCVNIVCSFLRLVLILQPKMCTIVLLLMLSCYVVMTSLHVIFVAL